MTKNQRKGGVILTFLHNLCHNKYMFKERRLNATLFLLKNKRIPPSLVLHDLSVQPTPLNIIDLFVKIPKEYKEKIVRYFTSQDIFGKPIIITGTDTVLKDEIAICFLILFACMNKKVKYYSTPDDLLELGYATAIMRIDNGKIEKVVPVIKNAVMLKRILIISAESVENLNKVFGDELTNFIYANSFVEIEVKNNNTEIIKL